MTLPVDDRDRATQKYKSARDHLSALIRTRDYPELAKVFIAFAEARANYLESILRDQDDSDIRMEEMRLDLAARRSGIFAD
jgi:hypothetical protein